MTVCGHCGRRDVGSPAAGYGTAHDEALCNPTVLGRPFCLSLVTTFKHPMNCRCEDRENPAAVARPAARAG